MAGAVTPPMFVFPPELEYCRVAYFLFLLFRDDAFYWDNDTFAPPIPCAVDAPIPTCQLVASTKRIY